MSADRFTIDHIQPQSLGGSDQFENLALACRRCNERRSNLTAAIDPKTETEVSLFNPRLDFWMTHFVWSADSLKIVGLTPVGRATVNRLDMNDDNRTSLFIQTSRRIWIRMGLHPPSSDPKLVS